MTVHDTLKRRRRWLWIVGGIAAAVALLLAWAAIPSSMEPLDEEVARLRAVGFPTTCAEALGEPPPDADNGFLDLVAARKELERAEGTMSSWTVTGPWDVNADSETWPKSVPPERIAELRAFLVRAQPFFDRVDAGVAKPAFRPVVTYDAGGLPSTGWVDTCQWVQKMLSARADAGATPAERLASITAAARLGGRIEPTSLIGQMVGDAIVAGSAHAARKAAEDGSIPAADLRRALDEILRRPRLDAVRTAARGEAAWSAQAYRAAREGTTTQIAPTKPLWVRAVDRIRRIVGPAKAVQIEDLQAEEAAEVVRIWSEVALVDTSSCVRLHVGMEAIRDRHPHDPSGTIRVVLEFVQHRAVRIEAARRLARVALAAAKRHQATGAWPTTAAELRDAFEDGVPLDPYTDAPFVIELTETTVRVRSAGAFADDALAGDATLRERILLWEFPR